MSAKTLGALLVGLIIGGGAGFAYISRELMPRMQGLQDDLSALTDDYNQLDARLTALTDQHEQLLQEMQSLQGEHDTLSADYETLTGEHETLQEQYMQLTSEYESLLSDYEAAFGGLGISPESIPVMEKTYTWTWEGVERTVTVQVPDALYDYYMSKERYPTSDYRAYVLHPIDDAYVAVLTKEFQVFRVEENLTDEELTHLAVSFVQSMEYVTDPSSVGQGEYPRFPVETLMEGGGDCEDTSILAASILESMGYNVSLLLLPNHMAVGLEVNATGAHWTVDGVDYYYLETTSQGWDIGEVPQEHDPETVQVFPIHDVPFIVQSWTATRRNEKVTVEVNSINEGRVEALSYRVYVALEDQGGQVRAETLSPPFDLDFKETKWSTLKVTGPSYETLRLVVCVLTHEGERVGEQYSTYFTTR